jgi:2-iminobutanoate/2-iminopropanoate deaminase
MLRILLLSAVLLSSCTTPRQYFPALGTNLPFSKAVLEGNTLYVSGHLGLSAKTGQAPADPKVEVELMLNAFATTLKRAGMSMNNLVQVQVYCSDVALYDMFNAAYRKRFKNQFPTRAFIGSGKLLRGCRFEILGVATR